jgi:hypothetical protein
MTVESKSLGPDPGTKSHLSARDQSSCTVVMGHGQITLSTLDR